MTTQKFKTYRADSGWFEVTVPVEWGYEEDQECVSIFNESGEIGCLQISGYEFPEDEKVDAEQELAEYLAAQDADYNFSEIKKFSIGDARAAEVVSDDPDQDFWKLWVVIHHCKLFFLTYSVEFKNKDIEIQQVDLIVKSISVSE